MIEMSGNQLRKKYLDFFASKDHLVLSSYPLVPEDDPTLLLIGAGMAPFKPFFTGKMKPPHPRISTSQKCVRTGDIENVGRTARHHTFFEMLGNFSFGDYFKKEAIAWAWEFITDHLDLPKDKLWITIHTEDDEAFAIWRDDIGVSADRIVRMDDNFWEIGAGPCGPCSELHIDLGEERGCGKPDCAVGCNCDRYLEIWNLVFTQYDNDGNGNYTPLAKKNIDTGAGLERIASVLQNKPSNFETDLLFPIIEYASQKSGVPYGKSAKSDVSLKVIADHARSMTVMIGDGILPSNDGRGYILRRILRRAVRHGRLLGIDKAFLVGSVDVVANIFAEPYPDLMEKKEYIKKVIQLEEDRFGATLAQGIELLNGHIQVLKKEEKTVLDGATAFKLYDTYGFPWELTDEILCEQEMTLDKLGFEQAMAEQRERARSARQEIHEKISIPDLSGLAVDQLKFDTATSETNIVFMWKDGNVISEAVDGDEVAIILAATSFYAEGGGQIGDSGTIATALGKAEITTTRKLPNGVVYHLGTVIEGSLKTNDIVAIAYDKDKRCATARNHTATHLLQAALRSILGSHVNQSGSAVTPDRLRFDFSHFSAVTVEQLAEIEKQVNQIILANKPIVIVETTQEQAKNMGAMALFGEKYGDIVRVVTVEDYSIELCGGSHVANTSEIGILKIVSESGIGSGVRRIEAVTGQSAISHINSRESALYETAALLKTRPEEVVSRTEGVLQKVRELEHEVALLQSRLAQNEVQALMKDARDIAGVTVIVGQVNCSEMETLRSTADMLRDRLDCGIVVLGAVANEKVNFVVMATPSAVARKAHAGNIVKEIAKIADGGGGGRPDMAQAGGKNPSKIAEALNAAWDVIIRQVQ